MWHKPCRTFHPWCLCIKTRCLCVHYCGTCCMSPEYDIAPILVVISWVQRGPQHNGTSIARLTGSMTSWHENAFRITGPFWRETDGCGNPWLNSGFLAPRASNRWFPSQRASDAELWIFFFIVSGTRWWTNSKVTGEFRHLYARWTSL